MHGKTTFTSLDLLFEGSGPNQLMVRRHLPVSASCLKEGSPPTLTSVTASSYLDYLTPMGTASPYKQPFIGAYSGGGGGEKGEPPPKRYAKGEKAKKHVQNY